MPKKLTYTTSLLLATVATPALAQAQQENSEGADSDNVIIVTAGKRQVDLNDATIAIDAFEGEALTNSGVDDLTDLPQVSTSLSLNSGGGQAQPFIRGIGSIVNGTGTYASVATYIDGVYQPRPYGLAAGAGNLDDVASIQVLKGPQGTIYGRNATGGAILIETISPNPGDDLSGSLSGTIGDFGVRRISGRLSSGLGDTLAVTINGTYSSSDGFVENLSGGPGLDDGEGFRVGGKIVWEPSSRFSATLSASRVEETTNNLPTQQVGQFDDEAAIAAFGPIGLNNPQALYAATVLQLGGAFGVDVTNPAIVGGIIGAASGITFSDDPRASFSNNIPDQLQGLIPGGENLDGRTNGGFYADTNVALNMRYSFDAFDVVAIGSYNDHTNSSTTDIFQADPASQPDLSAIDPVLGLINGLGVSFSAFFPSEAYSGDVYAVSTSGDIDWIVGLYYFTENGRSTLSAGAFEFDALVADNEWDVESIAAYGEVSFPITEELSVKVGGRYTDETYEIEDFFAPGTAANVGMISRDDSQFTYSVQLSYDIGDWLFYGGYGTGFKSGSLNPPNPSAGSVAPEEIGSFEVGFRGTTADGRLSVTGSGFYYDYQNIQLNILNPVNSATFLVDGVEAEVLGAELSFDWTPTDTTRISIGGTLLDHEYKSDGLIPATNTTPEIVAPINGNDLAMTADFVGSVSIDQEIPLGNSGSVFVGANARYNSGFWADQDNLFGSGGDENDSFAVVNASVRYVDPSSTFELSLYVRNLFDEVYYAGGVAAAGGLAQAAAIGRQRNVGATVKVNF